jgi:hypothetical protein
MKTKLKLVRVVRDLEDINKDYFLDAEVAKELDRASDGMSENPYDPEGKFFHLRHERHW